MTSSPFIHDTAIRTISGNRPASASAGVGCLAKPASFTQRGGGGAKHDSRALCMYTDQHVI